MTADCSNRRNEKSLTLLSKLEIHTAATIGRSIFLCSASCSQLVFMDSTTSLPRFALLARNG